MNTTEPNKHNKTRSSWLRQTLHGQQIRQKYDGQEREKELEEIRTTLIFLMYDYGYY